MSTYSVNHEDLLSRTISFLRFPLIVGVVFFHNKMGTINIQGNIINYDSWPWLSYIINFFSSVISAIGVPLFFIISGFLLFYKVDFNKEVYLKKIKSRVHTLLVPYIIWNFVGFLILLTKIHPKFASLFPLLKGYRIDIVEFLKCFWAIALPSSPIGVEHTTPIDTPLWYVRDLMILVLCSPIIYWIIKRFKGYVIVLLGVIWYFTLGGVFYHLYPISRYSFSH